MESQWRDCGDWGASVAGWASSYAVSLICILCAVPAGMTKATLATQFFLIFASATCLAFCLGGAAFMMLYLNAPCSNEWTGANHAWMYCWSFALAFWPFSPAALAAVALSVTSFGSGSKMLGNLSICFFLVLALGLAAYQMFMFVKGIMSDSTVYKIGSLSMVLVAIVAPMAEALRNTFRPPHLLMMLSGITYLTGGIIQLKVPIRGVFNETAFYHVFVALSVLFAYCACQTRSAEQQIKEGSRPLQEKYQKVEDASAKEAPPEAEPCCFCFRSSSRRKEPEMQWKYTNENSPG